ncbi:hypothetical protein Poly41_38490 [Novipirellula artificiosorum]|uniref:PKD domain-containing protein n=2 Tax=Novipirellula artificiosorum TaxID=2528016 RepID=A0A5C6DMF2_9BACT|nr:hypothetical protein Poly41_38490 [Novipirellula artificiosorum]
MLKHLALSLAAGLKSLHPTRRRSAPPQGRRPGHRFRTTRVETLEIRRLLVAEGEPFSISRSVDTTGLLGTVSAEIGWSDGTTSAATVSSQPPTGGLTVRLDYSLDTGGFFSGANQSRRVLMQDVADAVVRRFSDDLQAIVPAGKKQWNAQFIHPSTGQSTLNPDGSTSITAARNLRVNANELVVFIGSRDLAGNERGRGGPGGYAFPPVQPSSLEEQREILAFFETVQYRGETGAKATPATDFGPWGGSVAFDNNGTNWYFGREIDGIQPGQTDFVTVAMHELTHVLGFGRAGINRSWDTYTSGSTFTGPKATAAYVGTGNPPMNQTYHWAASILEQDNQPTLMRETLNQNARQSMTALDIAALDDIGWTLVGSQVTVSGTHVYGDNGHYPTEIVLRGSKLGETTFPAAIATVTNVNPTLTTLGPQSVVAGVALNLTDIGKISDPGFRQPAADPPSDETMTYSIDWGDQSEPSTGTATVDQIGNASRNTLASFNGSHIYPTPGNYTVRIRVTDDDGGSDEETFGVTVLTPPRLTLALTTASIGENAGNAAALLTISRSGPASTAALTVNLKSSDTSEASVQATAVIPASATSVAVPINAVDDTLLDGEQTLQLSATATGVDPGSIDLLVRDYETLGAVFSADNVTEDLVSAVSLTLSRSNTNVTESLVLTVSGGDASELGFNGPMVIPAGKQSVVIGLDPVNDMEPEPTMTFAYSFSAIGYVSDTATIDLLDDEPAFFQNNDFPHDVDVSGDVTAYDALVIINELLERSEGELLDPNTEQPGAFYFDANGDYMITALDALLIINELNETPTTPSDPERVGAMLVPTPMAMIEEEDDDEESDRGLSETDQATTLLV